MYSLPFTHTRIAHSFHIWRISFHMSTSFFVLFCRSSRLTKIMSASFCRSPEKTFAGLVSPLRSKRFLIVLEFSRGFSICAPKPSRIIEFAPLHSLHSRLYKLLNKSGFSSTLTAVDSDVTTHDTCQICYSPQLLLQVFTQVCAVTRSSGPIT